MSEVPLYGRHICRRVRRAREASPGGVQGYLADKKPPLPRTLQQDYVQGSMVVLGGGGVFL